MGHLWIRSWLLAFSRALFGVFCSDIVLSNLIFDLESRLAPAFSFNPFLDKLTIAPRLSR